MALPSSSSPRLTQLPLPYSSRTTASPALRRLERTTSRAWWLTFSAAFSHRCRLRIAAGIPDTHPVEGGSDNDYDYVGGDPVNSLDLDGLCKKKRGLGIVRNAFCHAGNVATKNRVSKAVGRGAAGGGRAGARGAVAGGRLAGRCAMNLDACATNIKIAVSPVIAAGATVTVAYGLGLACATVIGCLVGAPFLGPSTAAGAYGTYRLASEVWWGPNRRHIYHSLDE